MRPGGRFIRNECAVDGAHDTGAGRSSFGDCVVCIFECLGGCRVVQVVREQNEIVASEFC